MRRLALLSVALPAVLAAAPSFAAGGRAWFAYVGPVPAYDYHRQPVVDPATGKQKEDGFCLVWREGWVHNNRALGVVGGKNYYDGMSYRVNPSGTVTLYEVYRRDPRARNGRYFFMTDYTARLYAEPQPGWPCSQATWAAVLGTPEREYPGVSVPVPHGSTPQQYRERQRQMACDNPQIAGNRRICLGR